MPFRFTQNPATSPPRWAASRLPPAGGRPRPRRWRYVEFHAGLGWPRPQRIDQSGPMTARSITRRVRRLSFRRRWICRRRRRRRARPPIGRTIPTRRRGRGRRPIHAVRHPPAIRVRIKERRFRRRCRQGQADPRPAKARLAAIRPASRSAFTGRLTLSISPKGGRTVFSRAHSEDTSKLRIGSRAAAQISDPAAAGLSDAEGEGRGDSDAAAARGHVEI